MHKFNYKWNLKDGYPSKGIEYHGLKVFGTFINGGGSTMGYKLAGFKHLGGVEIDPQVADIYKENHNPSYLFVEDIREFNKRDNLPKELYELDILDGSPPCSTFSMAGQREGAWGKEKVFREGQAKQTLDDLLFVYVETINKLRPKVAILENVKGILAGNAKAYVKEVVRLLDMYGYNTQVFLFNAASMGVPQKRERAFFICSRKDLKYPKLKMDFNEKAITFKEIEKNNGRELEINTLYYKRWSKRIPTDGDFADICIREEGKRTNFSIKLISDKQTPPTLVSSSDFIKHSSPNHLSKMELQQIGSYPLDYNFKGIDPKYLIGMSVPPVMMAQISHQIYLQWFKDK